MKLVSEIFGTLVSTVTIIDPKKAAIGPIFNMLLVFRPDDVENDANAVFIVVPHETRMGVGSIAVNTVVLMFAMLGRVDVRYLVYGDGRLGSNLQRCNLLDFFLLEIVGFCVI